LGPDEASKKKIEMPLGRKKKFKSERRKTKGGGGQWDKCISGGKHVLTKKTAEGEHSRKNLKSPKESLGAKSRGHKGKRAPEKKQVRGEELRDRGRFPGRKNEPVGEP